MNRRTEARVKRLQQTVASRATVLPMVEEARTALPSAIQELKMNGLGLEKDTKGQVILGLTKVILNVITVRRNEGTSITSAILQAVVKEVFTLATGITTLFKNEVVTNRQKADFASALATIIDNDLENLELPERDQIYDYALAVYAGAQMTQK